MRECLFCGLAVRSVKEGADFNAISCFRCGEYRLSSFAEVKPDQFTDEQAANISGYIRENQGISIIERDLDDLRLLRTPTVAEKAMKGLLALTRRYPEPGSDILFFFHELEAALLRLKAIAADEGQTVECDDRLSELLELLSTCWARSPVELQFLLDDYLKGERLAEGSNPGVIKLTPHGWSVADEVRRGTIASNQAFVAMAFGEELTSLYDNGLALGIRRSGYDPVRIDRVEHSNRIDDEIIAQIRASKFLVADFTENRGGIYFEAGFAMGLGRPVIWTVRHDRLGQVHFDARQYNFIRWLPEKLDEVAEALQTRIEARIGRGPFPAN